jgi:hypothetical protein
VPPSEDSALRVEKLIARLQFDRRVEIETIGTRAQ